MRVAADPCVVKYFDFCLKLRGVLLLEPGISYAIDLLETLEPVPLALDEFADDDVTEVRDVTCVGYLQLQPWKTKRGTKGAPACQ